jgi:hypothetical protein
MACIPFMSANAAGWKPGDAGKRCRQLSMLLKQPRVSTTRRASQAGIANCLTNHGAKQRLQASGDWPLVSLSFLKPVA